MLQGMASAATEMQSTESRVRVRCPLPLNKPGVGMTVVSKSISEEDALGLPSNFEHHPELARAATSWELKTAPRHRWFYFPHSYSYRLVDKVLDYWEFTEGRTLADNFVGSGTTLLTARQRGLSAVGFDLSPLAVTVANTKIASYKTNQLNQALQVILRSSKESVFPVPERLSKAFTENEIKAIFKLLGPIKHLRGALRSFFLVALLWTAKSFSRAVPDGGWFRWKEWPDRSEEIVQSFEYRVTCMIEDVEDLDWSIDSPAVRARLADARKLPLPGASVDGFITSPPYANRHDYSRIFHIDLLLFGLAEPAVTKLRHRSIRSHVEAKRPSGYKYKLKGYSAPESLKTVLNELPTDADPRIKQLVKGYFEDIYLSLLEAGRILRPGGRIAYVVGNVRHAGTMIPVDEILADMASHAGLIFDAAWVMRLRGNSAQQMGQYGREPARETIVLFSKDLQ